MPIPTIGANSIKAVVYGVVNAGLLAVDAVIDLLLLIVTSKQRKNILRDWRRKTV